MLAQFDVVTHSARKTVQTQTKCWSGIQTENQSFALLKTLANFKVELHTVNSFMVTIINFFEFDLKSLVLNNVLVFI